MNKRRNWLSVATVILIGLVVALAINTLGSNLAFYYSPSEVHAGKAPPDKPFRIGGLVRQDSLQRNADDLSLHFVLMDAEKEINIYYKGLLPDLFREGSGAVVQGRFETDHRFVATEVLAKHDENYLPPEAHPARAQPQALK